VPFGIFTLNVVPKPGSLRAVTVPPCSFTNSEHQRQPNATPLVRPAPRSSTQWNRFKNSWHLLGGNADAGISDCQFHEGVDALSLPLTTCGAAYAPGCVHFDFDLPFEGELQCVREQVQHNLFPHLGSI